MIMQPSYSNITFLKAVTTLSVSTLMNCNWKSLIAF
jgi:hypothetical protein